MEAYKASGGLFLKKFKSVKTGFRGILPYSHEYLMRGHDESNGVAFHLILLIGIVRYLQVFFSVLGFRTSVFCEKLLFLYD